jgi:acyl carrier protein
MEVSEQVKQFINTNFYVADPSALGNDQSLLDAGIVDSTGVLEVIAFLEDTFGVKVDDAEVIPENLDTINRLVAFIQRKKA